MEKYNFKFLSKKNLVTLDRGKYNKIYNYILKIVSYKNIKWFNLKFLFRIMLNFFKKFGYEIKINKDFKNPSLEEI